MPSALCINKKENGRENYFLDHAALKNDATTLRIMTVSILTTSVTTVSITAHSITIRKSSS